MQLPPRYEIVNTLASGDFAVVYRARDRELGREVAIKQIHPQFLADPRQLTRYWQEAQLLASLQHPNIVTIYDIVRPRGWLILELMRGSLQPVAQGEPIDLDYLRQVLSGCLNALHFLHGNGVIHGDVKPSNILVGVQNRVKLGDFGLARRASNEAGSLLKGTTKYMAPELVSDQFGAVGPASDLYSLGFSAYELMCGAQFESLFPGLSALGRDKQIAWLMWQSAPDRVLPPIERVLEGVPPDLARVVQKMIVKDQARRYQSAQEALADLRGGGQPLDMADDGVEAEAARIAEAARKRRLRYAAIAAMGLSLVLCVLLLLPKKAKKLAAPPPLPHGVITHVYEEARRLIIASADDGAPKQIELLGNAQIYINGKQSLLGDLQEHDQVVVDKVDGQGHIREMRASRPEMRKGRIKSCAPDDGTLVLSVEEGLEQGKDARISVPADLRIELNGEADFRGQPVTLGTLKTGDRAVLHDKAIDTGREATELSAERLVTTAGTLAKPFDKRGRKLSYFVSEGQTAIQKSLPVTPEVQVTVNHQPVAGPEALQANDVVAIEHDTQIVRIDAQRVLGSHGTIKQVHYDARTIDVLGDDKQVAAFIVGPACKITLGDEAVGLDDLRAGDQVQVHHATLDTAGQTVINATAIVATRAADPTRCALLIAGQNYDDKTLPALTTSLADAQMLGDVLVKRYYVPAEQVLTLLDESQVRWEQGVADFLKRLGPEAKLVVYLDTHAYKDEQGKVFLAPKNFDMQRMAVTGVPLEWFVMQLEACPAKEKLLLLDCSHASAGGGPAELATADMLRSLPAAPHRGPLRTIVAIASCKTGQQGAVLADKGHGLFAWALAQGYAGPADANRDGRIEPTELFGYLQQAMSAAEKQVKMEQAPELFLPDARPPAISEETKQAARSMVAILAETKIDANTARAAYEAALQATQQDPEPRVEPRLLYGMLLMKAKDRPAALKHFEQLKIERPGLLLPLEAVAWMQFEKRTYAAGVNTLAELAAKIPLPKPGEAYSLEAQHIFFWSGQLREFAGGAVPENEQPTPQVLAGLDAATAAQTPAARELYARGRARAHAVLADFDKRIAAAEEQDDQGTAKSLLVKRRQLPAYVEFPFDKHAEQILHALEE